MFDPRTQLNGTEEENYLNLSSLKGDDFPDDIGGFIELAKFLKNKADNAEIEYVLYVRAYELSGKWKGSINAGDFSAFLKHYGFDVDRYRRGVNAIEGPSLGLEKCMLYGFQTIRTIGSKLSEPHQRTFIENVLKPITDNRNGEPISERHARDKIALYIAETPGLAQPVRGVSKLAELKAENEDLKRQVANLTAENSRLKNELSKLKPGCKVSAQPSARLARNKN